MKKGLIFGVGIAVAATAVGWWFWSLGRLPDEMRKQAVLRVDQPPVEIRRAGDAGWAAAGSSDIVGTGDAVRTGAAGAATLSFFGTGESRLGPSSEIRIDEAADGSETDSVRVKIGLAAGRIWSRVLRLFDIDSTFSVETNAVVATVRGTGFDVHASATDTVVWVSEAAVEMTGPGDVPLDGGQEAPLIIGEGFMGAFATSGRLLRSEAISEESRQSAWFLKNVNRDDAFDRQAQQELAGELDRLGKVYPDRFIDRLTRLSERLHEAFAGDRAPAVYAAYAARRLMAIKRLADEGKAGLALQALSVFEEDMKTRLGRPDGSAYRLRVARSLHRMALLLRDAGPSSPLYRLKQRLEDLSMDVASADPVRAAHARLLSIDARLDEAAALVWSSSLDEARSVLDTARQAIANVERDIDRLPDGVPDAHVRALRGKLLAVKLRETSIRTRLATALEPPTASVFAEGGATSTTSTADGVPSSPTSTAASPVVRIVLTAAPNPVTVNATTALKVRVTREDGTTSDVTAKSSFKLFGSLGSLNGPTYASPSPGGVTIEASYVEEGKTWTSSVQVQVQQPPVALASVELSAQGGTTVKAGSRVPLILTAKYTDGSSKDVTSSAVFSSSNPSIGTVTDGLFFAQAAAAGTVRIMAVYREGAAEASAFLDMLVQ